MIASPAFILLTFLSVSAQAGAIEINWTPDGRGFLTVH